MKRYKYFIYGNSGGIDKVINDLENHKGLRFRTLEEVFNYIADNSMGMIKDDLSIKYWCYDKRIQKNVFMVSTNRFGKDNYIKKGYTCFAGYFLIEL